MCPFEGNSQNFLRPCAKLISNISKKNLDLGSFNNFVQLAESPIFFSKIAPPYYAGVATFFHLSFGVVADATYVCTVLSAG